MKHEEGVKIRSFSVRTTVQKQKHPRLINHAKMELKKGYKGKWKIEASNSIEPFNNIEEGLKISPFTVHDRAQNSLYIGKKYYTSNRHTRGVVKQVQQGDLKQVNTLKQK
ncbi:hypothetical protein CsSME_00013607 [Camellia sinensis var. sinensis]